MATRHAAPTPASRPNHWCGSVTAVRAGTVNAEVTLALAGGAVLRCVLTQASVDELALAPGVPAQALVKPPWVWLSTGPRAGLPPGLNQLHGVVSQVQAGPVNAQVVLALDGGTQVHAVVSVEALRELGLAPGVAACALIKPGHVILIT